MKCFLTVFCFAAQPVNERQMDKKRIRYRIRKVFVFLRFLCEIFLGKKGKEVDKNAFVCYNHAVEVYEECRLYVGVSKRKRFAYECYVCGADKNIVGIGK